MKKKFLSLIVTGIVACSMFVMPVTAAEVRPDNVQATTVAEIAPFANGSFSGSSGVMNSLNGSPSSKWPISSGSIPANAKVSGVTVNATVSSGSAASTLYVTSPGGKTYSRPLGSTSKTLNFTEFNGENPQGTWNIWIVTNGVVTTVNARMTVNYSY